MENKIYSKWRDEDIAKFIPELCESLKDPQNIDPQQVKAGMDIFFNRIYENINKIATSEDIKKIQEQHDPKALLNILVGLENYFIDIARVQTFPYLVHHYGTKAPELDPALSHLTVKIQEVAGFLNQLYTETTGVLDKLDDSSINKMIEAEPKLSGYKPYIDTIRKTPVPNEEKIKELDTESVLNASIKFHNANNSNLEKEERKLLFAEGLTGMLRFKQKTAEYAGFKDTIEQFAFNNSAPVDMIDNVIAATDKNLERANLLSDEIKRLIPNKLNLEHCKKKYSFETAKDIVCSAYAKLDPELGKIANKAFTEGWVFAPERGVANPVTFGGVPSKIMHPFIETNFKERGIDVMVLGHEMGHLISLYLSGQKQNVLTDSASAIVQESFSHFGEKLIEQEMLKRAKSEQEKIYLKDLFLKNDAVALHTVADVKVEEDLYKLIKEKDGTELIDEVKKLYNGSTEGYWHILNQPPHTAAVYPITKIMSSALYQEFEKNPEKFKVNYREAMEAGNTIGISQLWDKLLGNGKAEQKEFVEKRVDEIVTHFEELRNKLDKMPYLPEAPQLRPATGTFVDRYEGAKREGMGHRHL